MAVFSMAGSNPALPTYPLQRSVRLRLSASAYFARTPASAGNRKTWTWSAWVKRGTLGVSQYLFSAGTGGTDVTQNGLNFQADDTLRWTAPGTIYRVSTQVFRDPSAWYHIVLQFDTTQATANDRIRLYVNGTQITAFSTLNNPTQNLDYAVNQAADHNIGRWTGASNPFDGYLTEVNFIDGQALTPSSFGAYNSYGVWSPAKYTGTYGTNGFYLNFQDNSALTTTANIGIGKDSSGNGNYWTSNGINVTAYSGTPPNNVSYDSMLDVPTNTSNTNANFATLNPVETNYCTLSNANLSASLAVTGSTGRQARGTFLFPSSGKFYFEVSPSALGVAGQIGIARFSSATNGGNGISPAFSAGDVYLYVSNGQKGDGVTSSAYGASYTTSDVIGVAVDVDAGTLTFYKNNVSQGTAYSSLTLSNYYPVVHAAGAVGTASYNINFGQRPFSYTPPTGFNRLNTYNLPDSIVPVGAQYMAATTFTGVTGGSVVVNTVNGIGFKPDFVWMKCRNVARNHELADSVRGTPYASFSNLTNAEVSDTRVSSFNSNGWTVGVNSNSAVTGDTEIGWSWRASNASAVTNTSGSITSQVSANQTAGFSIATWTNPTSGNFTVGHGLGVSPAMIIIKQRSIASGWPVYHVSLGATKNLALSTTAAATTGSTIWNSTAPTTTVFSVGGVGTNFDASATMVGYCFAAVPGYSAFGSYTGNGSTNGPFVFTNFRPRWIMFKCTSASGTNWFLEDTSRNPYNPSGVTLQADTAAAEANNAPTIDILSNGFKLRSTYSSYNTNGGTYIYAAFAENPFKNALAR